MADFLSIHTGQEVDDAVTSAKSGNTGSHPILYNTGHSAAYFPVNQRAFDGNWAALSIGDYGYDGWLKYSATHKAQIIELGDFEDIAYTISYDGAVVGTIQPPTGIASPWLVAVPFAADRIDLKPGEGYGHWQAEDGRQKLAKSKSFYIRVGDGITDIGGVVASVTSGNTYAGSTYFYCFGVVMREPYAVTHISNNSNGAGASFQALGSETGILQTTRNFSANSFYNLAELTADRSFVISDAVANVSIT